MTGFFYRAFGSHNAGYHPPLPISLFATPASLIAPAITAGEGSGGSGSLRPISALITRHEREEGYTQYFLLARCPSIVSECG